MFRTGLLVAASAGLATAQPFVALNSGTNPDRIESFDLSNPAATSNPIPLIGNFIRGFDLATPTQGWFVATSPLTGSATGFFRYEDGVSSMIAPMPQTNSAAGGLTLSADNAFLYFAIENPDSSIALDQLWRIDFDGTFTLIADITGMASDSPVVNGLAMSPAGVLYAIETASDTLYTIDANTGVATAVGPFNAGNSAIGGLDFGPDGRLYATWNFGEVYEIDTATGNATFLGELPFNCSSIAWAEPGPAVCRPDLSGSTDPNDPNYGVPDGLVDASDFFYFLDQFAGGNLAVADLSGSTDPNDPGYGIPDGSLDASDFFYFLDIFVAGCP